jgi:hypothetical protein
LLVVEEVAEKGSAGVVVLVVFKQLRKPLLLVGLLQ